MKGMTIAGFVLSIIGVVLGLIAGAWGAIIGLPVSVVGLILSCIGRKKLKQAGEPAGLGTAGLVIGIIAVVLTGIMFVSCGLCYLCASAVANNADDILKGLGY